MSFTIRPACLDADREEMLDLMHRNFGFRPAHRFNWSHLDNPAGTSWTWLAYDSNGNGSTHAVAMVSVFPRHMRVNGRAVLAGQVGGFAVDPTHRSLGPAVMVQRTTFQPVETGKLAFCYDCPPHDRGMSTFVRLGMKADCEVFRYAFPLRVDDNVQKKLGSGAWTKPIRFAGNVLLRMRRVSGGTEGIEIQRFENLFGDEFDHIDEITPSPNIIRTSRTARDLNYRYRLGQRENEAQGGGKVQVLVARRRGEIQAFAIYLIQTNAIAILLDIFGPGLESAGPSLLSAIISDCRQKGLASFHAHCSPESGLEPMFLKVGLSRRERNCRVVGYAKANGSTSSAANMQWAFTYAEVRL
jgi:hypothetical protein